MTIDATTKHWLNALNETLAISFMVFLSMLNNHEKERNVRENHITF
jgi:hypothetical protein